MKIDNLRSTKGMIALGQHILSASYNTLGAERLRNVHAPTYGIRTAWPEILIEFSDMVQGTPPTNGRRRYTSEEFKSAEEICDLFISLPYERHVKRLVLHRARTEKTYRELSAIFSIPHLQCRRTCSQVFVHLVQAGSLDKYKHLARMCNISRLK